MNNGFHVPSGFHVTTNAYKQFVADNNLQQKILDVAEPTLDGRHVSFEDAATRIHRLFEATPITESIERAIVSAYDDLSVENPAVAVRSSANAEDLPNLSFAGQQETYLICFDLFSLSRSLYRFPWSVLKAEQTVRI